MEFMSGSDGYEGSDLTEWYEFSRLKDDTKAAMTDMGIESFRDLIDVCSDGEMLATLKESVSKLEYVKFKKAVTKSKNLDSTIVSADNSAAASSSPGMAAGDAESEAVRLASLRRRVADAEEEAKLLSTLETITESTRKKKHKKKELEQRLADAEAEAKLLESLRSITDLNAAKKAERHLKYKVRDRKKALEGIENHLDESASLDLCVLEDCTGSMAKHIKACSDHIIDVADSVKNFYPDVPLRLGYVGYRDHCDGDKRLAVLRFTTDIDEFKAFVASQNAEGGGDAPEDVMGAIKIAVGMDWQAQTRIVFHVGDAPCHGSKYHSCGDSYPEGDPLGLTPEDLLPQLRAKNVIYRFGRMNSSTDKMIREFNSILGDDYIESMDVKNAATLMTSVSTSVTDSMYASISSSASVGEDSTARALKRDELVYDRNEPRWGAVTAETVNVFRMVLPSCMTELLGPQPSTFVERVPVLARHKVGTLPFSAGAVRVVYFAKEDSYAAPVVVHKTPLVMSTKDKVRERFEQQYISTHAAAVFLSLEFEKVKPQGYPGLEFVPLFLVQYLERDGTPYCTQEVKLSGNYEKYSNNSGMVVTNPTKHGVNHDVCQAFTHWTHSVTDGFLCVVDLQGVYDASTRKFKLTDPAIHCKDCLRYGGTNLHTVGFQRFFKTHKCNEVCRAMGLRMPAASAL